MTGYDNLTSRLRHRVVLQTAQLTEQDGGQYALEWQSAATVWAEIRPLESRSLSQESLFAEQLVAKLTHEVLMRYRDGVSAEMRLVFNGRYFNIRNVVNVGERCEILRLLVEESAAT